MKDSDSRAARMSSVVSRFRGRRIVVLGDLVCDEFVHGDIARVSREAPVLILRHTRTEVVPGGGGNAVANLRALGAHPLPVGLVGRDLAGDSLLKRFRQARIDVGGIRRLRGYSTPTKSRLLAGGVHTRRQQVIRIDRGALPGALDRTVQADLVRRTRRALRNASGLLVADYAYGAATPTLVRQAVEGYRDLPVMVDSRSRVGSFRRVTACSPNQEELEHATGGTPLRSEAQFRRAGFTLLDRTGNRAVLVTRGALGMTLFLPGKRAEHIPAFGTGEVADVTGAGDTVIATLGLALLAGADMIDAARIANLAAGLVVMKYGTATVTPGELLDAIQEDAGS